MVVRTSTLSEVEVDRLFHALADRTRREILGRSLRGEQSVSAHARHFAMTVAAVQKHVVVLERASLVTKERRGREQIVRPNGSTLAKAAALLDQYERLWVGRTGRMAELLSEVPSQTAKGGRP